MFSYCYLDSNCYSKVSKALLGPARTLLSDELVVELTDR